MLADGDEGQRYLEEKLEALRGMKPVDEKAAAKYPYGTGERGERKNLNGGWGEIRRRDGTIIKQ